MHLLDNVVMFTFLSFVIGVIADPFLRHVADYTWLSSRYLLRDQATYESIGILWYLRLLDATPLGSFNRSIHFTRNRDLKTFIVIRDHMASAEVSHWVGCTAMLGMTFVAIWYRGFLVGAAYVVFNILGNVYPCLLQQYNKRRLTRLIELAERRVRTCNGAS
ncbi:MAG: hypothetical protein AAGA03_14205 [Planctomycetota bacterium]